MQSAPADNWNCSLYCQNKAFFIDLRWNQILLHLYPECVLELGSKNYQSFINFVSNQKNMHSKNILKILLGQPLTVLGFELVTKYWEIIIALRVSVRNCGSRCWSRDNCCEQTLHPCHSINTQFGRVVKRLLRLFLQKHVHEFIVWSIRRKCVSVKSEVIFSSIVISYSTKLSEAQMCLLVHLPDVSSIHLTIPAFCRSIPKGSRPPHDPPLSFHFSSRCPYKHQKSHTEAEWKTVLCFLRQIPSFWYLATDWHARAFFSSGYECLHHMPVWEYLAYKKFLGSPHRCLDHHHTFSPTFTKTGTLHSSNLLYADCR